MSPHLVKPYTSQRWGLLRRASPGTPGEESAGRGSSQAVQLQVPKQGLLWKASVPFPPLQPPLLRSQALRKKNPKSSTTEQGIRQEASKRCLAWQGGAGLTSKTKKHFVEWKPVYLKHETSSLLGHISLPPSAGEGRERLLPANLALPEAVSNRDKPGLQGNRDTPPFC